VTGGEFICDANPVSGWSPAPVMKSAYFADGTFNELDGLVQQGGGAVSIISPGLVVNPGYPAAYAFRATTSGAYQSAYGFLSQPAPGELHVKGTMRFSQAPGSPAAGNLNFLQFLDPSGNVILRLWVAYNSGGEIGYINGTYAGASTFNILSYLGVSLDFAFWTNGALYKFWINGDEILSWGKPNNTGAITLPQTVLFGAITGGTAENWQIDFDALELRSKYYVNSFRVYGAPFAGIGPVYSEKVVQPDSQTVTGGYTQTVTRYPQYGLVQFASTDNNFQPPGGIQFRVIQNPGGIHAVDMLQNLINQAGAGSYINAATFAAAKAAKPLDIINFRMGDDQPFVISDALRAICSRCLYWLVVDHGEIRLFAYTGQAPTNPVLTLTDSNIADVEPVTDMDQVYGYVSAKFGWYDKDPNLIYWAGDLYSPLQGQDLDYTWSAEVAVEDPAMVKANVDLLYKFLRAQERWDPVKTNLAGARLELLDVVGLNIPFSVDALTCARVLRKDVNLDPSTTKSTKASGYYPLERVQLQLMRYLGES
jgi:hypothetical protein